MPSNQTTNYQLNQWAKSDQVLMEDFNADNAKLDAAIAAQASAVTALAGQLNATKATIPKIAAGTYTGDHTESRTIYLGFTPKAVFVCQQNGRTYNESEGGPCGGLAVQGQSIIGAYSNVALEIVTNGFRVSYKHLNSSSGIVTNYSNFKYNYIAIG